MFELNAWKEYACVFVLTGFPCILVWDEVLLKAHMGYPQISEPSYDEPLRFLLAFTEVSFCPVVQGFDYSQFVLERLVVSQTKGFWIEAIVLDKTPTK